MPSATYQAESDIQFSNPQGAEVVDYRKSCHRPEPLWWFPSSCAIARSPSGEAEWLKAIALSVTHCISTQIECQALFQKNF